MPGFAAVAQPWHDLFMLAGQASATLVGLMFVAASVGSGLFTQERRPAFRIFVSSSVVSFSCVLAACLVTMMPAPGWLAGGLLVGADGLFGFGYGALVAINMWRHRFGAAVTWDDRLLYALVPVCTHLGILTAAVLLLAQVAVGVEVLAVSISVLLLVGIRNAWDITAWSVMARRQ